MTERLTFNASARECRTRPSATAAARVRARPTIPQRASGWDSGAAARPEPKVSRGSRRDWAWLGLLAFTIIVFLRPQDQVRALEWLHLAEVSALVGLGGMVATRISRGLPPAPFTPEIGGLIAFGGAMLVGIPFSFWPGGSFNDFVDIYLKVLVVVVLMIHALDRAERIDRLVVLIVLSSGLVAVLSVFDYMRGINVVRGDRLTGAVGGIYGNPNDIALNMVVFLPFALAAVFKPGPSARRVVAALCAGVMMITIMLTKSRGGSVGLVVMLVALVIASVRLRPAIGVAALIAVLAAVPIAPASFWNRMVSIFDQDKDETGSRQARIDLMHEAVRVFVANPVFGVGLGQFVNYDPTGRKEAWSVTHNATLQVAAELGVLGLVPFFYLIVRAGLAARAVKRALVPATRAFRGRARIGPRDAAARDPERETLATLATAVGPALIGWIVCAQFASVALNWTFYFVLGIVVATREVTLRSGNTYGQSLPLRVLAK
jgi:putative inorganic carbon (HCO3(-)) transporter